MKKSLALFMAFVVASGAFLVAGCDKKTEASKQAPQPVQTASQPPPAQEFNIQDSVAKAQSALSSKNFGEAVEIARTAVTAEPKNAKAQFVMAEAQGANGDVFGALKSLDEALKNGYDNKNAIYASEYLEKTRKSAGFTELMRKYGLAQAKTPAGKRAKGKSYRSEDSISAGDVKINMKEVFRDDK